MQGTIAMEGNNFQNCVIKKRQKIIGKLEEERLQFTPTRRVHRKETTLSVAGDYSDMKTKMKFALVVLCLMLKVASPHLSLSDKERRVIFGADDRRRVPSATTAQLKPYSSACKLSCRGSCSWSCSCVLIGSRHVLSSAHCLDGVTTRALQVGFLEPNGRFQWYNVMTVSTSEEWRTLQAVTDDYAVLKLRRSTNRPHISVSSDVSLSKKSVVSITGFPGDKPSNSLWTTKCNPLVTRGLILNRCDVAQGSSGSGVFATDTSSGLRRTTVVGVLSSEQTITLSNRQRKLRFNVAVHLTRSRVSQIKTWTQN
ncbi:serine protease 23-like [Montipora foliosa]|uniref:serine protease 23-like n=1 Tax=Montipora foliosa TaxID=591990 RepID=UPI0035F1CCEF